MGLIAPSLTGLLKALDTIGAQQTPTELRSDVGILLVLDVGEYVDRDGTEHIVDEQQIDTSGGGTAAANVDVNPGDTVEAFLLQGDGNNFGYAECSAYYGEGGSSEPVVLQIFGGAQSYWVGGWYVPSPSGTRARLPWRVPYSITTTGLIPRTIAPGDGQVRLTYTLHMSAAGSVYTLKTIISRPASSPGAFNRRQFLAEPTL